MTSPFDAWDESMLVSEELAQQKHLMSLAVQVLIAYDEGGLLAAVRQIRDHLDDTPQTMVGFILLSAFLAEETEPVRQGDVTVTTLLHLIKEKLET